MTIVRATTFATMATLASSRSAHAAPPELDAGGASCPSATDLRRAIAFHLGRDDFDAPNAPKVEVHVRSAGEALVADVAVTMPNGSPVTRVIEGGPGGCGDLMRAAALSIALAIEAESPRPPATPSPSVVPDVPAPVDRGAAASSASDVRSDRVVLLASGMTTLGLLPRSSTGGAVNARVRIAEAVWLSARGFYLPEARTPNDAFGMTLAAGGAGACVEPFGTGAVAAIGCGHVVAGSLAVVGADVLMRNGGAKPFGAAAFSAGLRARVVGPLTFEGAIEGMFPFAHPTILTETCPPSGFQQPFAALALVFGAGVSIP